MQNICIFQTYALYLRHHFKISIFTKSSLEVGSILHQPLFLFKNFWHFR